MKQSHLAIRVRELRTQKGFSQDILAEESGLSHRTIQRIENGESNPTGDTIRRLSNALSVTPDELIDWTMKEDPGYLVFLNLSALSFVIFPILGILVPFIMWTSKKDKLKNVNKLGRDLINYQISWVFLLIFIPFTLYIFNKIGIMQNLTMSTFITFAIAMYLFNILLIAINTFRISNKKEAVYFSLIDFIR